MLKPLQHSMSNTHLPRALALLWLAVAPLGTAPDTARAQVATPVPASAGPAPTPLALSARQHANELRRAEAELRSQELQKRRSFKALDGLDNPRMVTRANGDKLEVGGDEWRQRRADAVSADAGDNKPQVSRSEAEAARQAVHKRGQAVEAWAFPTGGKYFQPDAGAKAAVLDWEKKKIIETGPPAWQKAWLDFVRWLYDGLDRLTKWIDSLLKRSPSARPVRVNNKNVELVFYLVLAGVLAGAAFLTWRALGGRVRRGHKGTRDILLEGEDQVLLRLPPDELMDRAQSFASQGNFREALRHRYLSLLLLLDARGVWRYDRRRTNWEHIARLRGAGAGRAGIDALSELTLRFDRVRYGNEGCDQSTWLRFDQDAQSTLEMLSRGANGRAGASSAAASGARG